MQQETVKHLELIQAVIVRMAENSFRSKLLTVIITTILFALAAATTKPIFVFLSMFPAIAFWGLDAYSLWEERLYRTLYDNVRSSATNVEPFLFSVEEYKAEVRPWVNTLFSPRIFAFHGAVIITICSMLLFYVWRLPQQI